MKTICGNSIEDCTNFVWSIVWSIPFINQHSILTRKDLFQIGFIELLHKIKERYKKNGKVHLICLKKAIRYKLNQELIKFKYPFSISHNILDKFNSFSSNSNSNLKCYNDDSYVDWDSLNQKKLVSYSYKCLLNRLGKVERICLDEAASKLYLSPNLNDLEYTLLKNSLQKHLEKKFLKKYVSAFIKYHFSERPKKGKVLLTFIKKYNRAWTTFTNTFKQMKEYLLESGGWVESEFGKKIQKSILTKRGQK